MIGVRMRRLPIHGLPDVLVITVWQAACWIVWRRWSEVKKLAEELGSRYGAGTPFNLEMPRLPR